MVSPGSGSCRIAFKEWASVCHALLEGRQTILLRKGGISEETAAGLFVPEHREFWLYPTWTHQAEQGVRSDVTDRVATQSAGADASVTIRGLVRVETMGFIESEESLSALEEHHILAAETLTKRFHYRRPGLWALIARVSRLSPGHSAAVTPDHAGCKTWVVLEEPLSTSGLMPVFNDDEWAERRRSLQVILGDAIS